MAAMAGGLLMRCKYCGQEHRMVVERAADLGRRALPDLKRAAVGEIPITSAVINCARWARVIWIPDDAALEAELHEAAEKVWERAGQPGDGQS
jgi:hypothetical protein